MKPIKCPAKEKKWGKKSEKEGGEKVKSKSQDSCVTISKFRFLRMPELLKLIIYFVSGSEGREVCDL